MKILCSKQSTNNKFNLNQIVNSVGRYLYKHLDGAFDFKKSSNMFDVYMTVLYAIPLDIRHKYDLPKSSEDVHEMTVNINLTTYQQKIRMNLLVSDPYERTISFSTYSPDKLQDMQSASRILYDRVKAVLCREFKDYDFLF